MFVVEHALFVVCVKGDTQMQTHIHNHLQQQHTKYSVIVASRRKIKHPVAFPAKSKC